MKKILLGCTAASILLGGIVFIGVYHIPLTKQATSLKATTKNAKIYTLEEEQILSAAKTYLHHQNLDEMIHIDVKADGNDFIITFKNPQDPKEPPHDLRLIRIADFNGKKQYRITSESWVNWAEVVRANFKTPQMTIDEYMHTISWVPDLSLTTNSSFKATDVIVKDTDLSLTIGSVISDSLVAPQNNKMDIAMASTMTDLNIKTQMFELRIPKIILDTQIIGTNQTGKETIQALSSEKTSSSLMIPTFTVFSPLLGTEAISGTIENSVTLDDNIDMSIRISDIKVPNIPTMPLSVNAQISLNGLDKADIISYMELSEKYEGLENPASPEGNDLEKQLLDLYSKIAPKLSINVEDMTLTFKEGSISLNGTIKPDGDTLATDATIQVVNFDTLSPKPQPADKEACEAALKNIPADATQLPPECAVKQTGMLDILRPFLDTTKRTINAEGQSVDTFKINYSGGGVSINGEEILPPSNTQPTEKKQ